MDVLPVSGELYFDQDRALVTIIWVVFASELQGDFLVCGCARKSGEVDELSNREFIFNLLFRNLQSPIDGKLLIL